jgi:hypothetical protein
MGETKTIEEMHAEISEAQEAINEAEKAKNKAKNKLKIALSKCGASPNEEKVSRPKPQRYRAKTSKGQLVNMIICSTLSTVALIFSVVSPLSVPSTISIPVLMLIVLAVGVACSVIFIGVSASLVALYLSLRQNNHYQPQTFSPYEWLAQMQSGVSLEDDKPKPGPSSEQEEMDMASLLQKMKDGELENFDQQGSPFYNGKPL